MYRSEPLFAYAHGLYAILPPDLPKRFYPEEESRIYKTDRYVICFNDGITDDKNSGLFKTVLRTTQIKNSSVAAVIHTGN